MTDLVRVLNDAGIQHFIHYLAELRAGSKTTPPYGLLTDSATSLPLDDEVPIDRSAFEDQFAFGKYLSSALSPLDRRRISHDYALWTWLALYFFDHICAPAKDGSRKILETAVYVLEKQFNHQRYYRHLVRTPWLAVLDHGDNAKVLLITTTSGSRSDIFEQLTARQGIFGNQTVIAAANALYLDRATGRPKRGASGKGKGSPRRLVSIIQQLDLTYDLRACTVEQFLELLPKEFERFRTLPAAAQAAASP